MRSDSLDVNPLELRQRLAEIVSYKSGISYVAPKLDTKNPKQVIYQRITADQAAAQYGLNIGYVLYTLLEVIESSEEDSIRLQALNMLIKVMGYEAATTTISQNINYDATKVRLLINELKQEF